MTTNERSSHLFQSLVILLALTCKSAAGARLREQPIPSISNSLELFESNQEADQQQRQLAEAAIQKLKENPRKYLIRGPKEDWKLSRLTQLLEALTSPLPSDEQAAAAPILRTSRTYPSVGGLNFNQLVSTNGGSAGLAVAYGPPASSGNDWKQPLVGIVWPRTRPIVLAPPPYFNPRKFSAGTNGGSKATAVGSKGAQGGRATSSRRLGGSEEFAFQTPPMPRSSNDYEWKRVENSRWNNLRGMWGKRNDATWPTGPLDEQVATEGSGARVSHESSPSEATQSD